MFIYELLRLLGWENDEVDAEVLAQEPADREEDHVVPNGTLAVEKIPVVFAEVAEHGQVSDSRIGVHPVVGHEYAPVVDHPASGARTQPSMICSACVEVEVVQLIDHGEQEARHAVLAVGIEAAAPKILAEGLVQRDGGLVHAARSDVALWERCGGVLISKNVPKSCDSRISDVLYPPKTGQNLSIGLLS